MKFTLVVILCILHVIKPIEIEHVSRRTSNRGSKKLFGGYKITPKFCKPTRKHETNLDGPNICMFNHECNQRNGIVVGACMDGFLFGACCQIPAEVVGELLLDSNLDAVMPMDNNLLHRPLSTTRAPTTHDNFDMNDIIQNYDTSVKQDLLPTANDNAVIQIQGIQDHFNSGGATHTSISDTFLLNEENNINNLQPDEFNRKSSPLPYSDIYHKTTPRIEQTTAAYTPVVSPIIHISISSNPNYHNTQKPYIYGKPIFKPKPSKPTEDKYVLIPTITHVTKPNRTSEFDSIINIIQMLNDTTVPASYSTGNTYSYSLATTKKPPSTSYLINLPSSGRPSLQTSAESKKPPSTSYVYSSTPLPPRPTDKRSTVTKSKPTKSSATKPFKITSTSESSSLYYYPNTNTSPYEYMYSSTVKPAYSSANTLTELLSTSKKPLSTSYVFSSTISRRPTTNNGNPTYSGYPTSPTIPKIPTASKYPSLSSTSKFPSAAPTIIILGPTTTTSPDKKKPVTQLTINNHVTNNLYNTDNPSPTILITPKPSTASVRPSYATTDYNTFPMEVETSVNDLNNFPPVRNPNLNISASYQDEFTTPAFLEDENLDIKMESFVNKIVQGLQEPFKDLKDVVYKKNSTLNNNNVIKNPTTKKPAKVTSRPSSTVFIRPSSPKRPTTRKPTTILSKKPTNTVKKTTTPKKVPTTTPNYIETDLPSGIVDSDYRSVCGIRPLLKSGRIVGGKGAAFGAFPWQVLVRESTWLGLFTKNKCGGVLISDRYVMTAAHCQPGFLASLVAVFGEHDISGERESKRSLSRNVKRVIVHREYDATTFENDLALLELEHPVQFDEHIVPICLPREGEDFTGKMATVTGWGRLKYNGGVPSILQEVQVPIMENQVCQEMFRTANHLKIILESFLCAGYANGQKDSCEGDSGGPLVLKRPDGRYQLAGTVSHGIKCAAPYLPGVYMRTSYYKPWIESITGVH